jgi:pantetheine-phosphate adenylyltransferase
MTTQQKIGLFPGTFDPITNGHLDVIHRGRALFDRLIVAIAHNPVKRELFDMSQRLEMARKLITDDALENVTVESFQGLTVDYAKQIGATAILRGLRNVTDLNYEFQLALTNRAVADIETVFIMTGEAYAFTSSSLIRQIAAGGDVDRLHRLLPPLVLERLKKRKEQLGPSIASIRVDGLND